MYIYKTAVVGAGLMGAGIAQVISYSGIPVILKDVQDSFVQKGLATARQIYEARVQKGKMTAEDLEARMAMITGTATYDGFDSVDLVIEAAPEKLELKKSIFAELGKICPSHTILASNTSSLPISAMGAASGRPDRVAGLHFFYPASVMKLVEVIGGLETSQDTLDTLVTFSESLRKIPVRVRECAGFLVNRILMPYLAEATAMLGEGFTPQHVDQALVSFGMPMGPFKLVDTLGLDVCADVAQVLYDEYGERMRVPEILRRLRDAGFCGIKSQAGFYVYDDRLRERHERLMSGVGASPAAGTNPDIHRPIMAMINEAAVCLEERVASAGDVDLAMVAGTGFPQDIGGPLHYADALGLDAVIDTLKGYVGRHGRRFWPSPALTRLAAAGYLGKKSGKGFFVY